MKKILYKTFITIILLTAVFFYSCAEDPTTSLQEYPSANLPVPEISSVNPPNEALAGVTVITISGKNFSTEARNNRVYFNGQPATVISATSTLMELISPVVVSDTVIIKMAVVGSESFSNELLYQLKPAVSEFYPFDPKKNEIPYAVTTDNAGNVFVSLSGQGTKKIDATGLLSAFAPKGPETFFRSMTFASDNNIYAVRGGIKGVYRVAENNAPAAFVSSANGIADNVNSLDFDNAKNVIWAGGNTGVVYRITLDKNIKKYNLNGTINSVKVAGNSLFVALTSGVEELVWKLPIVSADSLGLPELYFNFSSQIDTVKKIAELAIAEDGDIYLGTNSSNDPIYVIHPDKTFEIHYPGLIKSSVYSLSWGNDKFMYMTNIISDVNTTILKIDMQKLSAP